MEISLVGRLSGAGKTARPGPAGKGMSDKAGAASSGIWPETDKLTLTRQAMEKLAAQSERLQKLLEPEEPARQFPYLWDMDGEENGHSELDAMEEGLKTMRRCMEIARRIMRGDKVPPEDERYLMENDPNGFKLAMAMRRPKKHPKEWKSVLEDEKKSEQSGEGGGKESVPAAEASGGASEGGAADSAE